MKETKTKNHIYHVESKINWLLETIFFPLNEHRVEQSLSLISQISLSRYQN